MSFLIGLLIIFGIFLICWYLKIESAKKIYILVISVLLLNFLPLPRNEHLYSPELAEYYEPQSIGFGWPVAFLKYYPNCAVEYPYISTKGQLREGYSVNTEKSLAEKPFSGKDYLLSDNNCPDGTKPAFFVILSFIINFLTAGVIIFLIRRLIKR